MTELELTRRLDDRRMFALGELGTLRREGLFPRAATADAGGRSCRFTTRGLAQDASGAAGGVSAAAVG